MGYCSKSHCKLYGNLSEQFSLFLIDVDGDIFDSAACKHWRIMLLEVILWPIAWCSGTGWLSVGGTVRACCAFSSNSDINWRRSKCSSSSQTGSYGTKAFGASMGSATLFPVWFFGGASMA